MQSNPAVLDIPAYRRPANRPATSIGFRIYKDQDQKLKEQYPLQASELVRALLDKFFRGEIPDVKEQLKTS